MRVPFVHRKQHKKMSAMKGFTLVETLAYIGILLILLTAIVQSLVLLTSSYRNIKLVRSIENSAIASLDRMTREIKNATDIVSAESSFNTTLGQLTLQNASSTGSSTVSFFVSNNRVMVSENGVTVGPLSSSNIQVTSLTFRSLATTTASAIKIEMTLVGSTTQTTVTKNFYTTGVIRGTY